MPKWKLVIEYEGTRYRGWQEQKNARTVQGELRKAAEGILGSGVEISGSGRTDAGVHALCQVAHLAGARPMSAAALRQGINDRLPADINIRRAEDAPARFHARHHARERFYLYQISRRRTAFGKHYVWWVRDRLDVGLMRAAARRYVGMGDFVAYKEKEEKDASTLVDITGCAHLFGGEAAGVQAVRGISLDLGRGETLGIVGESGSGKSTLARMLVGLERPTSGTMVIDTKPWAELAASGSRAFGRTIQYVFQDPVASLNPRKTIGEILDVPLRLLCNYDSARRRARKRELVDAVQMPADTLERYPHEFSGGQAQRIAIARALAAEARILVLDEPVSALDVSVQAQVLLLLQDLRDALGLSYLFISHDLAVVESISDRVAVMYLGEVVETGPAAQLFAAPQHDYTRSLIASAPRLTASDGPA